MHITTYRHNSIFDAKIKYEKKLNPAQKYSQFPIIRIVDETKYSDAELKTKICEMTEYANI
jgi:hypothetical protein